MKTKSLYKFTAAGMLIGLLGIFIQCVPSPTVLQESSVVQDKDNSSTNNQNNDPETYLDNVPDTAGEVIQEMSVSTGIKNYEQLMMTMSSLTGVQLANDVGVRNIYNDLKSSLPTDNDIKVYSPTHQVAITRMAAEFCNSLIVNQTLRANVYPNFNFSMRPTDMNQGVRDYLIETTISHFWGDVVSDKEKDAAHAEMDRMIDELLVGERNNSGATQSITKAVCTMALASAHVTLL